MAHERLRMRVPGPERIRAYVRHHGARRTLARSAYVAANRVAAVSVFGCMTMRREDVNRDLVDRRGLECRFLAPDELVRVEALADEHGRTVIRHAHRAGNRCFAVLEGGELVNVGFYAPRPTPLVGDLLLTFTPPDWYMYGAITPPEQRGRRLHGLGIVNAALALFDEGVPRLVTVYERTNYNSMVSALRMGWQPCGSVYRVGVGSRMHVGRTAGARREGMALELLQR